MNEELISVVMTSYNHKEYIGKAIEHILNQSYKNIELIIVDDCSTDGSQEVIRQYASDPRVRMVLRDKNFGNYVLSTNYGASLAKGEYINFAQCDDFADSKLIETLYNAVLKNQTDLAFCASFLIDENDRILCSDYGCRSSKFQKYCKNDIVIKSGDFRKYLFQSCVMPNLSAILMKKALFDKHGGLSDKFRVLADWDLYLRMSHKTDVSYVRSELNFFRQHESTIRNQIAVMRQKDEQILMYARERKSLQGFKRLKMEFISGKVLPEGVFGFGQAIELWKITMKYSPWAFMAVVPYTVLPRIQNRIFRLFRK